MRVDMSSSGIWVVGASNGIGLAVARKYISMGEFVIVSSRNLGDVYRSDKLSCLQIEMDVRNLKSIQSAYDEILKNNIIIKQVIYCVGSHAATHEVNIDTNQFSELFATNFFGFISILEIVIPHFLINGGGNVAVTVSPAGYIGLPRLAAYGSSKAALISVCESMRVAFMQKNIKLQIIAPGFVKTQMTENNKLTKSFLMSPDKAAEYIMKGINSKRFEIRFPLFSNVLFKLLSILPYPLYFIVAERLQKMRDNAYKK
jgi:short-subunit dehydrogenase